jgi:hypothetical protein
MVDRRERFLGGVSNVDMAGNNALYLKAIEVFISTFETLPTHVSQRTHALRGAVKVFLLLCRLNSPSGAGVVRYGG